MAAPLVSVIVLGWGGESFIARCLTSLLQQTYPRVEIVVVDNASPDATAAIVERDFPQVKLIRTPQNLGVAGGNNAGFRAASGEVLILTNVDTSAAPNWVEVLVRALADDETIGVASSKLIYPNGTIQYGGGVIDRQQGFARHAFVGEPNQAERGIREVDFATGASLAIRRQVLEAIGFEDEAYFPIDYEDSDLSYRARLAGWRVAYIPEATSTHYESSTVQPLAPHRVLSSQMGRLRFVAKFWSDEHLVETFLPAETRWLAEVRGSVDRTGQFLTAAMPLIYFKTILDIDDLVAWRVRLDIGHAESSRATLMAVLTRLRLVSLPQTPMSSADLAAAKDVEAVRQTLRAWLPQEYASAGAPLLLSMQAAAFRVNSHVPIAFPVWPPGVLPKMKAALQKATRRLLRWYIDPLVLQQNEINAHLLGALQALSQELLLLKTQVDCRDRTPEGSAGDAGLHRPPPGDGG